MVQNKKPIEQYSHQDKKRVNNPPVGLVKPELDQDGEKKRYAYDPHLDPQLVWAGKAEHTSFEVPTVSLHVHERIDPRTIIEAVRKKNGSNYEQLSMFNSAAENPPLREAVEFYKHPHGWTNRLIAGDSLLVMNSLLQKEGMAGKVQMVYIDPPYGIKYGSNFQPFVNKRDVKDGKDEDLTSEPEMIKAFRDTWELGIHSYLAYLRDRLLLAKELLTESGSVFVQISDENVHHARELIDEVFGSRNHCPEIAFEKTRSQTSSLLAAVYDHILWYAKSREQVKYRQLYMEKAFGGEGTTQYIFVESPDGNTNRRMTKDELEKPTSIPQDWKIYSASPMVSESSSSSTPEPFLFEGNSYFLKKGSWKTNTQGFERLKESKRVLAFGNTLMFKRYYSDFPYFPITNLWQDTFMTGFSETKLYVVQTSLKTIQRCVLMSTDPGDLVLDITCGSGTTANVAEEWGRRWITCDTSRVAITLAKQRLMTALFDYYQLAQPQEGVGSGFKYKTVSHVTLKSIANSEPPDQETLYDKPLPDSSKLRVSGPFTVEAVPSPSVKPLADIEEPAPADESIARSGETLRQAEWRDELLQTGIRGKRGQYIMFSRIEPLPGRWLHAEAETKKDDRGAESVSESKGPYEPQRAVISFGPEHALLDKKQVERAVKEAEKLVPQPRIIVFAAFRFDPEAAKDIDETNWPGVTLLKVEMNNDLQTQDLKKKRSGNDSFWLIGQPDVKLEKVKDGKDKGKYRVSVLGFDYYNTKTGVPESGGTANIAMWLLDTDYDGRSLFPRQVFFPMASDKDGWARLAKNLKAEIDENLIEAYRGTVSLPFEPGPNGQAAVKIVDDRGIESLKIIEVA